jgi:subtilisin family serine protease
MARYVMANRRSGKFSVAEKIASRASISQVMSGSFLAGASIIRRNTPRHEIDRQLVLFEADPTEMEAKIKALPADVIVEPEIIHQKLNFYRPMDFLGIAAGSSASLLAQPLGTTTNFSVRVKSGAAPLPNAEVSLFLRFLRSDREAKAITDATGIANFVFPRSWSVSAVVVIPAGNYWPMVQRGPTNGSVIDCPPLPNANNSLAWWHNRLGIDTLDLNLGSGIKVGVIDSGVGPHPFLDHVTSVGAYIDGNFDPTGGADVDLHGSHVCGIIGARPSDVNAFAGIAPGVDLFCARVFPPDRGASQIDIANAIDELANERQVDLINMSLGAARGSQIELDAIQDALETGTLCICAAGNSNGPVEFPAAFDETVAVSAIGLLGWGPDGSIPATRIPFERARFGSDNLYHANFSCFGAEITCSAPGVGIISTIPAKDGLLQPYASLDGTSMASPAACGALAAALSRSSIYQSLPRDITRSGMALQTLQRISQSIGLARNYEGRGMPDLS